MTSAQDWVSRLGMTSIDLGGWFSSAMGSDETLAPAGLPQRFAGSRAVYSSNWYLLEGGHVLRLHRLNQDELWFFHEGASIDLHIFSETGYRSVSLGHEVDNGQSYNGCAPHSTWFGAEVQAPGFALASCSLSPGWAPPDSTQADSTAIAELCRRFPAQQELIGRLR
jgi:uncharacterized protein